MTATKTPTAQEQLDKAELLVEKTGQVYNDAKSALRELRKALKPAKAPKADRGPSARGVLIAALIVNPSTDITDLVASLGCLAGTVNESRMAAKAVADIREGFAPSIGSSRLVGEALRYSGAAALPTKLRPSEPKAIEPAKPAAEPSKKAKQIAAGGTIRKGIITDALAALEENPDLTLDGLVAEVGCTRTTARNALATFAATRQTVSV